MAGLYPPHDKDCSRIPLCQGSGFIFWSAKAYGLLSFYAAFPYCLYTFCGLAREIWQLPVERQKNQQMTRSHANFFQRLIRNKGAFFGLIVITAALFVAV